MFRVDALVIVAAMADEISARDRYSSVKVVDDASEGSSLPLIIDIRTALCTLVDKTSVFVFDTF